MADERKKTPRTDSTATRVGRAKLGQDLLVQLQHDFVAQKARKDAELAGLGQALLGKVAQDFGSGRPPPPPQPVPGSAPPPPAPPGPITLAPPPSPQLVQAEADLARAAEAPLGADDDAELNAMQGGGFFGFLRRLFRR